MIKCFSNFPLSKTVNKTTGRKISSKTLTLIFSFFLPRGTNLSTQKGFKNAHDTRIPVNGWMNLSPWVGSRSEFEFWLHGASRYSAVGHRLNNTRSQCWIINSREMFLGMNHFEAITTPHSLGNLFFFRYFLDGISENDSSSQSSQ